MKPSSHAVVCINSTLAGQTALVSAGAIAPIHHWGFVAGPQDATLCHGLSRLQIVLRSRFGGLDLPLLARLGMQLMRGRQRIYLVTSPDIWAAVPLLQKLCPTMRLVTWTWTAADVVAHLATLKRCAHVFCLTEGALLALRACGFGDRASLQYWGVDPSYYLGADDREAARHDVALLGQTNRDLNIALRASVLGDFDVITTRSTLRRLGGQADDGIIARKFTVEAPAQHRQVIDILHRSRVSWIPLLPQDERPTGYTNLAESLLAGTPAIIADSSVLPSEVLRLPGVFRYRAGDANDLVSVTREVLSDTSDIVERRRAIHRAAATLFDVEKLTRQIDGLLRC